MSKREEMLAAIRTILKTKGEEGVTKPDHKLPPPLEDVMPTVPASELVERFEAELQALGCKTYRAADLPALEAILRSILEGCQAQSLVLSRNPLLAQLKIPETLKQWNKKISVWAPSGPDNTQANAFRRDCFAADAGISGADFALVESGSFVLSSLTEGSQLASLAPPAHIVIYRRHQVRASLDEVLQNLPVSREPDRLSPARSVVFVTGPSRTADIEQILVRGVHGPRDVHAVLAEESCLLT